MYFVYNARIKECNINKMLATLLQLIKNYGTIQDIRLYTIFKIL